MAATLKQLLGHMAAAAAVTPLGLLHMRPLQHWLHGRVPRWAWQSGTLRFQVTPACCQTFTPWSDLSFLWAGVPLEQVSRHAVVYTDASAKDWGATFNGHAVSGVWTGPQLHWHINCLELLAVHLALNRLKRRLRGEHVLVHTDSTATVAYINRQGGLRPVATAPVPPLSGRAPARLLSENLNMRCTCCLLILTLWSAAAGCNNRMPMCIGSFSLHSKWIGLSKRDPNSSVLRRDVSVPSFRERGLHT